MIRENIDLFYNLSLTAEDKKKIEMYKQQAQRVDIKNKYTNIEDYLDSLELKMTIFEDDESIIPHVPDEPEDKPI